MAKGILQYRELAEYCDLLYQWKGYGEEAEILKGLIERYETTGGNSLPAVRSKH
ncbi:MAG TPA: hypothetical protein VEJ19_06115 [Nitrososphaerales archaeon]|nr:hypothetical protein [Nitrososphaerales archaeon]